MRRVKLADRQTNVAQRESQEGYMLFVTGDIHGDIDIHKLNTRNFPIQEELTRDDFIVICGDFGLVWDGGRRDQYWLDWLEEKTLTTLFVDGNHENFDLLSEYSVTEWNGGKVQFIRPHVIHLTRGQVFTIEGKTFFTMGGASSHDRGYRQKGKSWWPQELPNAEEYTEAERNLEKNGWTVDYVLTHCAPSSVESYLNRGYHPDRLTMFLESLYGRLHWTTWYMGHYHQDLSFGKYRLLYNDVIEVPTAKPEK